MVNGSAGIAVGMATNIPPHNLREIADGVQWYLANPEASKEELLEAMLERVKGPDFPTGATDRGPARDPRRLHHRPWLDHDARGRRGGGERQGADAARRHRSCPTRSTRTTWRPKIAELVNDGKIAGIAELNDETSARTGQRLVIVLKRDAVAQVVLNNLYKHTQLQDTFGANMLALVDGVPRTLPIDAFVRHWVTHQIEVIVRRTQFRLRKAEARAHILRALLKALDALDEVIALIRAQRLGRGGPHRPDGAARHRRAQATAILDMQLRRLAALERQKIIDEYDELMALIAEYNAILESPERQRQIISEELAATVEKFGDERRTQIVPWDGEVSMEDLIAEEDVVVTITRGGYAKRTNADLYRSQRRGGKGIRGATLRQDDIVEHFFVTTTHHWILFFTNKGRVYRTKAYELPDSGRDAKGMHVANLLAFQPDETIAQVDVPARLLGRAVPGAGDPVRARSRRPH